MQKLIHRCDISKDTITTINTTIIDGIKLKLKNKTDNIPIYKDIPKVMKVVEKFITYSTISQNLNHKVFILDSL